MIEKVKKFMHIDEQYRKFMDLGMKSHKDGYLSFARMEIFPTQSDKMLKELEGLMQGINDYLCNKRANFPRLYLLSNDKLMDLVNNYEDEECL
jgi:tRNA/tmRNA/rRNA uracil-C5-methylase (TrmA/RlmC/RlmD family)